MHIISAADFPSLCSNSARKCFILHAECLPQKSLILLEILPAEVIQAQKQSTYQSQEKKVLLKTKMIVKSGNSIFQFCASYAML